MKTWKVIFAALVLFVAGALTGAVVTWKAGVFKTTANTKPATKDPSPWIIHRPDFVELMKREMALTPEQADKVTEAVRTSRQRTDFLWEMLKEPLGEELQLLKQNILAVLSPDQQKKFEELVKPRPMWKPGDPGHQWGGGRGPRPGGSGGSPDRERERRPEGPPPPGAPPGGKPGSPPPAER